MKRIFVCVAICMFFVTGITRAQELWTGKDGNIRNVDTRAMIVTGGEMYLATRSELYRLLAPSGKWESVFSIPAGENEIQCAAGSAGEMLVGTKQGIFKSFDRGRTWRKVFKAITPEKNDILSIDVSRADGIVAGTCKGVYFSADDGAKWSDPGGALKNRRVDCVVLGKGVVYAGGPDGVFAKRSPALHASDGSGRAYSGTEGPDQDWEKIYVLSAADETPETAEEPPVYAEEDEEITGTSLALKGSRLYIGAGGKISYTDDGGKSWAGLSADGLAGNINCILPSRISDAIYCATAKGVFEFSPGKKAWKELYRGTDKLFNVRNIVFDKDGENAIWAATNSGVYRFESGTGAPEDHVDVERTVQTIGIIYDGEPSFTELQKAAMKFAEVDPDKIKKWRAQARLKALVPKISLGIDNNQSNTYEIYTSATKDYVVAGPDDITKGFDVSISWELGDMIYSDDQTNIDVRSRLTTQLRNDILDELRRAYYERKRLQFEIVSAPPKDLKARFEKELRIRELAQAIDDLTDNYLTENMKKPEE